MINIASGMCIYTLRDSTMLQEVFQAQRHMWSLFLEQLTVSSAKSLFLLW